MRVLLLSSILAPLTLLPAQRGDRPGEKQTMLPESVVVPPAAVRTPAEELLTLQVPAGVRVELFAAEPHVQDPIAVAFDNAGRLWVVEMRAYMPDVDGTGEAAPEGRIVVLHDDDRDGRADRSTVFVDGLVLPRAVLPMRGGALVIAPPELVWMPDADGDLVADGREVVMGGFEAGIESPEHSGNGLVWGLDHLIHLANDRRLLRRTADGFAIVAGSGGGQWGLCHDDRGRFYFNYNSDWLHCDLVPGRYASWASATGGLPGWNLQVVKEQSVWPARITPGVNRGYQQGLLRDWKLTRNTAVCGPLVYRGDLLPFDGDAFLCEPAGNCIRRVVFDGIDGVMVGANPYQAEQKEFLTSTDERFRPVNLANGPDGALYVVDMYRGIIQHKVFVTSFLRDQIERRDLARPIHLGRIWRVVPAVGEAQRVPTIAGAPAAALVAALGDGRGAVRDLALRELVGRGERAAAAMLRNGPLGDQRPAVRIAALSALAGIGALDTSDLRRTLRDADPGVLSFALQHAAPALAAGDGHVWAHVERLAVAGPDAVRWHLGLAIGEVLHEGAGDLAAGRESAPLHDGVDERCVAMLAELYRRNSPDEHLSAILAAASQPRLGAVLARLVGARAEPERTSARAVADLARRTIRTRSPNAWSALLDAAAGPAAELAGVLLKGAVGGLPKADRRAGWIEFSRTPVSLTRLVSADDEQVRKAATELLSCIKLSGAGASAVVAALDDDEQARVRRGEAVFRVSCAACHQLDGRGLAGLAPALADSEWVTGPSSRLVRIALQGVRGPIEVDGTEWNMEMPSHAHLTDQQLAEVLSFLRRAFGHRASCVTAEEVKDLRAATSGRAQAWTAAELRELK